MEYYPLVMLLFFAIMLSCMMPFLSMLIGIKNPDSEKLLEYECGFDPFGQARQSVEVSFILVGMLFMVFDLEMSFLFPWSMVFPTSMGMFGSMTMLSFLMILTMGLMYEWVSGGLEWS